MQNFITIAGVTVPQPSQGLSVKITASYDRAINANGAIIGQKVGRDRHDLENLEWGYLKGETWRAILQALQNSPCIEVTYPDMATGTWVTRTMLVGDREAVPIQPDPETGLPLAYCNCKLSLTDIGT